MADISRVILPSGDDFDLKDSRASRVGVSSDNNITGSADASVIAIGSGNDITETTTISGVNVAGATVNYLNGKLVVYGTTSGSRTFLCLNGQNVIKISSDSFAQTLLAGRYVVHIKWSGSVQTQQLLRYTPTTYGDSLAKYAVDGEIIDTNVPIMLGLYFRSNDNYGTAENPTYIDIWITPVTIYNIKDSKATRLAVSSDSIDGSTNVSAIAIGNGNDITETTTISSFSVGGATADYINGKIALYGTSSSVRTFLCLNGQCAAKITTSVFEQTLAAGRYVVHLKWSGYLNSTTHFMRYTPTTFGDSSNVVNVYDGDIIDTDVAIMIGLYVFTNTSYGTVENPTYFDIWITPVTIYNVTDANAVHTDVIPYAEDIVTRYRVHNFITLSSNVAYIPLAKLPDKTSSSNSASLLIQGRIGDSLSTTMASIRAIIWNRGGAGISFSIIGAAGSLLTTPTTYCDFVIYDNSDGTSTIYIKGTGTCAYDIDCELASKYAEWLYDGTYSTDVPTGTLAASASTATNRMDLVNGVLYVSGNAISNVATTSDNGLMSSTDKAKLDNCTPMRVNNGTLQYLSNGTWTDVLTIYNGTVT